MVSTDGRRPNSKRRKRSVLGRGRGRPRLPPDARRSERIRIRLTGKNLERVKGRAKQCRLSLGSYIELMALTGAITPPPPIGNRDWYRALARVGNNLNQHVRQIHEGKYPPDNLRDLQELREIVQQLVIDILSGLQS